MRARTWSLMVNLDSLNAAYLVQRDSQAKADFLDGFLLGCNHGFPRDQVSAAFQEGHSLGLECRTNTEAYRQKQSENGRTGGRPPKEKPPL